MKRAIAAEKAAEEERQAKAEADFRRERIAAGLHRKSTRRAASIDKRYERKRS